MVQHVQAASAPDSGSLFLGIVSGQRRRDHAEVADRVAVMQAGRIVEVGPTAAVLSTPTSEYTRILLASVPKMKSALGGGSSGA